MKKNHYLVPVDEARKIINRHVKPCTGKMIVPVANGAGYVMAQTVRSAYASPPFNQSAMDGYALRFEDYQAGRIPGITGESAAGINFNGTVRRGQAVRIFTGACIPKGADTVVMQEKVRVNGGNLVITDKTLTPGANIRKAGSQLKKGAVAVRKGCLLNPGATAFLASLGLDRLHVYRKPSVAIIITGSELTTPGRKLKSGQIYESNSTALSALLQHDGITQVHIRHVTDNLSAIRKAFLHSVKSHDFIIFTGGISVGDYDYVGRVAEEENVQTLFYKIRQKPGKPLFFGKKDGAYIFGLPGNPASVLTCYYEFVGPALKRFAHHPEPFPVALKLPLKNAVAKKPGLAHFLRAVTDFQTVEILPGQESFKLQSFVMGNCLVALHESDGDKRRGDLVDVHLW